MTTDDARAAGITPNNDEEQTADTAHEVAPTDLLLLLDRDERRGVFIAAGDPIPAEHTHLPRVDRDSLKPLKGN